MLANRLNGLINALAILLLAGNCACFVGWWALWRLTPFVDPQDHDRLLAYLIAIVIGIFYASRRIFQYRSKITSLTLLQAMTLSFRIVVGMLLGAGLIFFLAAPVDPGRFFLLTFVLLAFPVNTVMLKAFPVALASRFFLNRMCYRAVVVGEGALPASLLAHLDRCRTLGVHVVGYYSRGAIEGLRSPRLGNIEDLLAEPGDAARPRADCVLAFNLERNNDVFRQLVRLCQRRGARLQAYTQIANLFEEPVELVADGDVNFLTFLDEPLEDPVNRMLKRALDCAIALPVVVGVLPVLCGIVWIAQQRQSPGPLLYKQKRYGENRRPFWIWKFRTMHCVDPAGAEFRQAQREDPRVYPFGRFLRRMSLDEFPQFVNVLRGEMSVVGPRPHPVQLDDDMEHSLATYRLRHFVRPGITGYAQVLGLRGETPRPELIVERVRQDLWYIRRWSLGMDLKIILRTVWQVLRPPDAAY